MQIEREKLLDLLNRIEGGLGDGKGSLAGTDAILLNEKGFHTYNNTICVTAPCMMEDINGAVNGQRFMTLVKKYHGDLVTLEGTKKGLVVKCGKNKSTLKWMDEISTPDFIANLHSIEPDLMLPKMFQEALVLCSLPNNKTEFDGVFVHENAMHATDRHRFSIYQFPTQEKDEDGNEIGESQKMVDESGEYAKFYISGNNTKQLARMEENFVGYTTITKDAQDNETKDEWIHFEGANGTIFSCTLLDFEVVEVVLPFLKELSKLENNGAVSGHLPDDFRSVVERVGALSSKGGEFVLDFIKLTFDRTKLSISSESIHGDSEEELNWISPMDIEDPVSYYYTIEFLLGIYGKARDFYISSFGEGEDATNILVFENDNFKHIVSESEN